MELKVGYTYSSKDLAKAGRVGGIYLFVKEGEVLYVGKTNHITERLESHHYGFGLTVLFVPCNDSTERAKMEREYIDAYDPLYNRYERYPQEFEVIDDTYKLKVT